MLGRSNRSDAVDKDNVVRMRRRANPQKSLPSYQRVVVVGFDAESKPLDHLLLHSNFQGGFKRDLPCPLTHGKKEEFSDSVLSNLKELIGQCKITVKG